MMPSIEVSPIDRFVRRFNLTNWMYQLPIARTSAFSESKQTGTTKMASVRASALTLAGLLQFSSVAVSKVISFLETQCLPANPS
jgi:hypothetical protein